MFKEKIEINFRKKPVVTRTINGQNFKVSQYLSDYDVSLIVESCLEYYERLFKDQNLVTAVVSTFAQMDMLILVSATNLKLDGKSYEDISSSGLTKIIQEDVSSYNLIKTALSEAINTLNINRIVDSIGKIATTDAITEQSKQLKKMIESNPEQAEKFLKIAIANNPELSKLFSEME